MPLYGVGFNEYQQLVIDADDVVREPEELSQDAKFSVKRLKCVTILWSRIIAIAEDCTVLMRHLRKADDLETERSSSRSYKIMDDTFSTLSGSLDGTLTFNCSDKMLLLWNRDFENPKTISCNQLSDDGVSFESIHITEDGKTLLFRSTSGTLYKSTTSLNETRETSSLIIQHLHLLPDRTLPIKVRQVSCGKHHTLILTGIGVIFSFGVGNQGQLGIGSIESREQPTILEALEGLFMLQVSAGGWHSLALTDGGDIYAWGWNNYGQLGLPSGSCDGEGQLDRNVVGIQPYPVCLEIPNSSIETPKATHGSTESHRSDASLAEGREYMSFVEIASGSRHSLALNSEGEVYSWGWNKYGQLGYGSAEANDRPKKVDISGRKKVDRIFAGHWNSLFQTQEQ